MEFSAISSALAAGPHRLTLENRHLTTMSVYLDQRFPPRFATVQITRQKRTTTRARGKSNSPFIRSVQRLLYPVRGLEWKRDRGCRATEIGMPNLCNAWVQGWTKVSDSPVQQQRFPKWQSGSMNGCLEIIS